MKSVCICFQMHHQYHTRWYWPSDAYNRELDLNLYFDMQNNFTTFIDMCRHSFNPTINMLLKTIKKENSWYTLNITGTFLDQCPWDTDITASIMELVSTGNVELTCSPYYNSISSLMENPEFFEQQVIMHKEKIKSVFGSDTPLFLNSDMIYTPRINSIVQNIGCCGIVTEGADKILNGRQPTKVFRNNDVAIMTRHINLSEDVEKRFSTKTWVGYPLIPEKFATWISNIKGDVITLYIDCATFGGHVKAGSDIFEFFEKLPLELNKKGIDMITLSDAIEYFKKETLPALQTESVVRYGMASILGNHMQHMYFNELENLGKYLVNTENQLFDQIFGYLQQVDILSAMNSHNIPVSFDMAVNNFSILSDFKRRVIQETK